MGPQGQGWKQRSRANENWRNCKKPWNDAIKFKDDALAAFRLGYLSLTERAVAEQLTWACADLIANQLPASEVPEELRALRSALAKTDYANLSIFRSAPDTWAIDQLFPVMPIHRLNEKPQELGSFADLTCDSDGKLERFIDKGKSKSLLELHTFKPTEPYWIGMFLAGAYQEVMGNLHNLFGSTNAVNIRLNGNGEVQLDHVVKGDTNAQVLEAMEHNPSELLERLRVASETAIRSGQLNIKDASRLMDHLRAACGKRRISPISSNSLPFRNTFMNYEAKGLGANIITTPASSCSTRICSSPWAPRPIKASVKAGSKIPTESANPRNNKEVNPEPTTKPDRGRASGQIRPSSLQA
jgi:arginine decarboxylase-like protein